MNNDNNTVKNAVWLGASLLSYGKYLFLKSESSEVTKDSFWLSQSELLKFSQEFCKNKIQNARISQWYNGDHPNSSYNYLKSNGSLRRLTAFGEFKFNKELPTDINLGDLYEYDYKSEHIKIFVTELIDWVKNVYSKIILQSNVVSNIPLINGVVKIDGQESTMNCNNKDKIIKKSYDIKTINKPLDLEKYIHQFMDLIKNNVVEVYNEFSLQHELGIYLRNVVNKKYKIQFERNVEYFNIQKEDMLKKEMDIVVFNEDKSEKYCIELKYPSNGQFPEQMFAICKDVRFLEQLIDSGFICCYSVNLVEDRVFYNEYGNETGIYEMFRKNKKIEGLVVKPTGSKDMSYKFKNSYDIKWNGIDEKRKYFIVETA